MKKTGVSLFELEADKGDILSSVEFDVESVETATTLYAKAAEAHIELMNEIWLKINSNNLQRTPQNNNNVTNWPARKPEDGEITSDFCIEEIERLVRAITFPYPGAFIEENKRKLIIWSGRIVDLDQVNFRIEGLIRGLRCYEPVNYEWATI